MLSMSNFVLQVDVATSQLRDKGEAATDRPQSSPGSWCFQTLKSCFSYSFPHKHICQIFLHNKIQRETTEVGKNPAVMYGAELKLFELLKDGCSRKAQFKQLNLGGR